MKNILSVFLTIVIVLSIVAIPVVSASSITGGEVYTELYRMDFDDMEAMSDLTTDLTAFNNTYGRSAKLLSKKPEENGEKLLKYAIYEKTAGSSDKYIDIKQQNGNSRAAIQITLPDGGFKADNGTYKISFDVKINTETYKPFFRIKTNHLDDPMTDSVIAAANGFYDWGPCLSAIGPINTETGLADRTAKTLYGTYSTWDYTNGAESNSDLSANLEMDKKVELEFGEWINVDIKIDTVNKKVHYYYNGVYTGLQEDNTFGTNYLFSAKNIQLQSIQKYQVWNGCKLDNITISHSDSEVVNPETSFIRAKSFKELYRLDFDKLENREVDSAGTPADASVFNTAYSGVASIGGDDTTYAWGILPKEDNNRDKYLMLTHSDLSNTHSKVVTLRLNLADDERPSKDSGIYKLSYDMRINDGKGQKPFMQLKTYHYDPSSYTDYWAPCLSAIGPMTEANGKDWTDNATVYGTYSAHAGYGETVNMETGAWYPSKIGNKHALALGQWHNVEILFDTNNAKADYYYDGVYVGTQEDATFAKNYLFGNNTLKNLQFQIFQGFQSKGFQVDNIVFAKEMSSSSMKAEGFEGISAIDLSEDYKKLIFSPQSNIGNFTDAVIVDGSSGEKVAVKVSSTTDKTALDFSTALNKDGLYTIYLFGEKASVYGKLTLGNGVAEEVFEKNANLELVSLDITDNNDGEFAKGDTVTAKAVLRNGTGIKQSSNLILAVYNNDSLSDVKFKKLSSQAKVFEDSLSIPIENGEGVRVSAFVWDDNICPVKKYSPVTVVWYDVVNKTTFDSACSYAEFEADVYYDDKQTKVNKISFSDGVSTGTLFEIRENKLMLGLAETEVDCLQNGWYNIKSVFDYTDEGGNLIITVTCPDGAVIQRADPRFMVNTSGVMSISVMAAEDGCRNVITDTEREIDENELSNSVSSPQYPDTSEDAKFADNALINLVTTFYEDAKTTRGFAWTADAEHTDMIIQYAEDAASWETDKIEADAVYTSYDGKLYYKVDIDNLAPGESYIYRLGDAEDDLWSDFYTFETEPENAEPFSFIAVTDPQSSSWSGGFEYHAKTMAEATKQTDAAFVLNLGDMVNTGYYESEWNGYFKAVKGYAESLPHMSVVGNHEARGNETTSGKHFALHFNNPQNGSASLGDLTADDVSSEHTKGVINNIAGSVYSFDYGDAHFAVLNSGSDWDKNGTLKILEKQAEWLENDLNASDKKWKIVMVHQGCYPAKTERYNTRSALLDVIDSCGVDLVLQGHDHIVTRTYPMRNDEIISKSNPNTVTKGEGTVYTILGSSGPKRYDVVVNTPEYAAVLNATKAEQPTYSVFSIDNDSIDVITRQINGMVVDKFTITDN